MISVMPIRAFLCAVIALDIVCILCLPVFASSYLMRGIAAYKRNDYARAQTFLRQAIKDAPEDSVAHYYLANTLVKLKNPTAARAEFKLASDSSETDDIKENSKNALQKLQSLERAVGGRGSNPLSSKGADTKTPVANPQSSKTASLDLDSVPLTTEEKKAIKPYLKSSGDLDQTKASSMIKDLLPADLKNRAQGLGPQDPALPGLLSDFLGQTQFGAGMSAVERKSFIEDELHRRNIPMDSILQMINGKSASSKANTSQDERSKRLKEVQDNLDDQMNSQVGNSGVHLKPEGTSIYVRNYEHR